MNGKILSILALSIFLLIGIANAHLIDPISYNLHPYGEAIYPDNLHDAGSPVGDLTDGVYGSSDYFETTWVGWDFRYTANPAVLTFDFGNTIEFTNVTVGYNNTIWAGIAASSLTEIRFSDDSILYGSPTSYTFTQDADLSVHRFSIDVLGNQGQYAQLTFWQGAGASSGSPWVFIDEVDFEGTPVPLPSTCLLFFFGLLVMGGIKKKFINI